jgi:hypothetical protein
LHGIRSLGIQIELMFGAVEMNVALDVDIEL